MNELTANLLAIVSCCTGQAVEEDGGGRASFQRFVTLPGHNCESHVACFGVRWRRFEEADHARPVVHPKPIFDGRQWVGQIIVRWLHEVSDVARLSAVASVDEGHGFHHHHSGRTLRLDFTSVHKTMSAICLYIRKKQTKEKIYSYWLGSKRRRDSSDGRAGSVTRISNRSVSPLLDLASIARAIIW